MAEPRTCTLTLDDIPPSPNARGHYLRLWRRKKELQERVAWQALATVHDLRWMGPLHRAHIVATITHRSRRYVMDQDNATAALGCLLNGIKGGLIVPDDDPSHVTLEVRQDVGQQRGVTLEITEVLGEPTDD